MKLSIMDDQGKAVEQELGQGTYKVGRGESCEILLDDETTSREHCVIEVRAEKCILRDSGSMNGTLLNDKAMDEAELKDGDVISLGRTKITVSLGAAPKEAEAPAGEAAEGEESKEESGEASGSEGAAEEAKPSESES